LKIFYLKHIYITLILLNNKILLINEI
jgi:hypothetical protein